MRLDGADRFSVFHSTNSLYTLALLALVVGVSCRLHGRHMLSDTLRTSTCIHCQPVSVMQVKYMYIYTYIAQKLFVRAVTEHLSRHVSDLLFRFIFYLGTSRVPLQSGCPNSAPQSFRCSPIVGKTTLFINCRRQSLHHISNT